MQKRKQQSKGREADLLKGLAAGLIGGLSASIVMNQFQKLWSSLSTGEERAHGAQSMQQGSPQYGVAEERQEQGNEKQDDDATERVAGVISEKVFHHELTEREKETAGAAVHYAFGISTGAAYGVAAELVPFITVGVGLPFGAFVWVTADEGLVPLLGLSKPPTAYPLSIHAYAFASHLVYGLTTDVVRRMVRNAL